MLAQEGARGELAQQPTQQPTDTTQPVPPVVVHWSDGVTIESPDGNNKFEIGGLFDLDGRFGLGARSPITDTLFSRRARITLRGRVARYFEFYLMPEFASVNAGVIAEYLDFRLSNTLRIRAGKSTSPVGYEQAYGDALTPFPERSVANNLTPNSDVGVDFQGTWVKGHLDYDAGVRNGVLDGVSSDSDTDNSKELVGRVTVRLGDVGLAIGASHGKTKGLLPTYRDSAQQVYFAYAADAQADGTRNRVSPTVFLYHKSVGGYAEFFRSAQTITHGTTTTGVSNQGWNATGLFVLTGERLTARGVTPRSAFDPVNRHWGALELVVRAAAVAIDPKVFRLNLNGPGASRTAKAFGIGLVWYCNPYVKQLLSYERTVFDSNTSGQRPAENAIALRLQIAFAPSL